MQHVQGVSKSLDLSLPAGADEQSINFTLAQLIMVMERLDTQIGAPRTEFPVHKIALLCRLQTARCRGRYVKRAMQRKASTYLHGIQLSAPYTIMLAGWIVLSCLSSTSRCYH